MEKYYRRKSTTYRDFPQSQPHISLDAKVAISRLAAQAKSSAATTPNLVLTSEVNSKNHV